MTPEITTTTVNGCEAAYISIMGEHTPGVNSDALYIDTRIQEELDDTRNRIIALVADGITGEGLVLKRCLSKFVADNVTTDLPGIFEECTKRTFPEFQPETSQLPEDAETMNDLIEWLIPDASKEEWGILRNYTHLFVNKQNQWYRVPDFFEEKAVDQLKEDLEKEMESSHMESLGIRREELQTMSPEELADLIFIPGFRNHPLMTLLIAINKLLEKMRKKFSEEETYQNIINQEDERIIPGTTLVGIIDAGESYMLFSIGDSTAAAMGETVDVISVLGRSLYFTSISILQDEDEMKAKPPYLIGYKEIYKEDISPGTSMILASDGYIQKIAYLVNLKRHIASSAINTPQEIIRKLIEQAEEDDRERKKWNGSPDDKTAIVIMAHPEQEGDST